MRCLRFARLGPGQHRSLHGLLLWARLLPRLLLRPLKDRRLSRRRLRLLCYHDAHKWLPLRRGDWWPSKGHHLVVCLRGFRWFRCRRGQVWRLGSGLLWRQNGFHHHLLLWCGRAELVLLLLLLKKGLLRLLRLLMRLRLKRLALRLLLRLHRLPLLRLLFGR